MSVIANRNLSLLGEVTESNYEAGRYFLGGNELAEQFVEMQRDVFAFVSDQDRVVTVTFVLEVGPARRAPQARVRSRS